MTQHDDTVRLRHMLDHAREAAALVQDKRRGELNADRRAEPGAGSPAGNHWGSSQPCIERSASPPCADCLDADYQSAELTDSWV